MHQCRQQSVPNVVGLCLAHCTHNAEVSLGPCWTDNGNPTCIARLVCLVRANTTSLEGELWLQLIVEPITSHNFDRRWSKRCSAGFSLSIASPTLPQCASTVAWGATRCLFGCGGPHDRATQTSLARFQLRHQSGSLVQSGPTNVLDCPTTVAFVGKKPRPQFAQLRRSAPWEFAALAAESIRTLPVDRSTLGAKDDGVVQSSASSIGNSSQLKAVPSECARVQVTVLQETWGENGRKPVRNLTCSRRSSLLLPLSLESRSRGKYPWSWRSSPGVVPPPEPEQNVRFGPPNVPLAWQGSTGNNTRKAGLCVSAPFFAKVSARSFPPLHKWEVRPASTSRSVAWPLTLTALTSSWENRSLFQTCARGPCAPKALCFGPLIVAMVPSQSM